MDDWQNGGFGLYLHWPFCAAKCPYCDFNSHVSSEIDQNAWLRAYISEIDRYADITGPRVLNSVFFGGGTPSLMNPDLVAGIIEHIRKRWPMANDAEITLEANPTSVEAGRFVGFRDAGVSRISMGIQALNDPDLKRLGRMHTAAEAMQAFDIARKTFDRVSFDLIYARQDQTLDQWRAELTRALDMAIDHLSLYQLTIEDGTAFGARHAAGGLRGLPTDDLASDMYFVTQELCDAAGMSAYEVSNHAKTGSESRHNLIYWRYGDFVGIGPGAHGRLTLDGVKLSTQCVKSPTQWLENPSNSELPRAQISAPDQASEMLMMGLRLREGIDMDRFAQLAGRPLSTKTIADLSEMGMLKRNDNRLCATDAGRVVLNAVLRELLAD